MKKYRDKSIDDYRRRSSANDPNLSSLSITWPTAPLGASEIKRNALVPEVKLPVKNQANLHIVATMEPSLKINKIVTPKPAKNPLLVSNVQDSKQGSEIYDPEMFQKYSSPESQRTNLLHSVKAMNHRLHDPSIFSEQINQLISEKDTSGIMRAPEDRPSPVTGVLHDKKRDSATSGDNNDSIKFHNLKPFEEPNHISPALTTQMQAVFAMETLNQTLLDSNEEARKILLVTKKREAIQAKLAARVLGSGALKLKALKTTEISIENDRKQPIVSVSERKSTREKRRSSASPYQVQNIPVVLLKPADIGITNPEVVNLAKSKRHGRLFVPVLSENGKNKECKIPDLKNLAAPVLNTAKRMASIENIKRKKSYMSISSEPAKLSTNVIHATDATSNLSSIVPEHFDYDQAQSLNICDAFGDSSVSAQINSPLDAFKEKDDFIASATKAPAFDGVNRLSISRGSLINNPISRKSVLSNRKKSRSSFTAERRKKSTYDGTILEDYENLEQSYDLSGIYDRKDSSTIVAEPKRGSEYYDISMFEKYSSRGASVGFRVSDEYGDNATIRTASKAGSVIPKVLRDSFRLSSIYNNFSTSPESQLQMSQVPRSFDAYDSAMFEQYRNSTIKSSVSNNPANVPKSFDAYDPAMFEQYRNSRIESVGFRLSLYGDTDPEKQV